MLKGIPSETILQLHRIRNSNVHQGGRETEFYFIYFLNNKFWSGVVRVFFYENIKTISINPQSQTQVVFQQFILPFLFQIRAYKLQKESSLVLTEMVL